MFVAEYGSGRKVVLGIHGWGGDHQTFAPLQRWIPYDWTIIAPDLPGYGRSPLPMPLEIEKVAKSLALLIEAQRGKEVVIVGSCSGALLGLETALLVPNHIQRIVALDLFAYMPWYFRFFVTEPVGSIAYRLTFASRIGRAIVNAALQSRRTQQSNLMESFSDKDHAVTRAYLKALSLLPGPQRYATLNIPVTLVWGERTFAAVRRSVAIWRQYLRNAKACCIGGAGHLLLDEAPEKVAPLIFGE